MNCRDCQHWQGNRLSQFADCNWVVGHFEPKLFEEKNELGFNFNVPFDPHDLYRFNCSPNFRVLYKAIHPKEHGQVKIHSTKGQKYFMTREDFCCGFFKKK